MRLLSINEQGQVSKTAPIASGLPAWRYRRIEGKANSGLDQSLQRHREFHASDAGAGAEMWPGAKGEMPVRLSIQPQFVWPVEYGRIAVG